jgi:hypothetical protein
VATKRHPPRRTSVGCCGRRGALLKHLLFARARAASSSTSFPRSLLGDSPRLKLGPRLGYGLAHDRADSGQRLAPLPVSHDTPLMAVFTTRLAAPATAGRSNDPNRTAPTTAAGPPTPFPKASSSRAMLASFSHLNPPFERAHIFGSRHFRGNDRVIRGPPGCCACPSPNSARPDGSRRALRRFAAGTASQYRQRCHENPLHLFLPHPPTVISSAFYLATALDRERIAYVCVRGAIVQSHVS